MTIHTSTNITLADVEAQAQRVYGHGYYKITKSCNSLTGCCVRVECTVSYTQKNGVCVESWYEDKAMLMAFAALVVIPDRKL